MPTPNPMEDLLKDDDQKETPEPNEDVEALKESVNTIGESLTALNEKLSGIEEKMTSTVDEPEPEKEPEDWKPVTWKDVDDRIEEKSETKAQAIIEEKEKQAQEDRENKEKALKVIDDDFDKQISDLEKEGLLVAVKDEDDANDPGRAQRREMFGYAATLGTLNLDKVAKALQREHERGYAFDVKSGDFIATKTGNPGKFAPVGSSSNRASSNEKAPIDYKTIHNMSVDQLIERSMKE